jgi:hypothetical protein
VAEAGHAAWLPVALWLFALICFGYSLVVDGDDRVVLIRQSKDEREQTTARTIDSIPTDLVARLDYDDLAELGPCDAPLTGP